jgi:hypothetical protein
MLPKLDGQRFETVYGIYRLEEVTEPQRKVDSYLWTYWLRFKWVDPHDENNKVTPEFRFYLDLYEEEMLADDAEGKLLGALSLLIEGPPMGDNRKFSFRLQDNPCLKEQK